MVDKLFKIQFPVWNAKFVNNDFVFSIQNIKSRYPSVVYFKLSLFDMDKKLLSIHFSNHQIVTTKYKTVLMDLSVDSVRRVAYYQLELIFDGLDDDNTCSFNGLMFEEAPYTGYHRPNEIKENVPINFRNSKYVNLYNGDTYLQVIRPNKDKIHTTVLDASECTVIAPHFSDDADVDDDVSVFFEFCNQREQSIDILK